MLSVEVRLAYTKHGTDARPIEGWYLPSTQAASWLQAYHEIGSQIRQLHFFLAPTSATNQNASALIAVVDAAKNEHPTGPNPSILVPTGAIPLVKFCAANQTRLLLPLYGTLTPLCESEIKNQLLYNTNTTFVWLPQSGLICFEPEDQIQPALLMRPVSPPQTSLNWKAPQIPPSVPDRLPQISMASSMDMQQFFSTEREQIGGDPHQLDALDETGNPQPKKLTTKMANALRKIAAKYVNRPRSAKNASSAENPAHSNSGDSNDTSKASGLFGNPVFDNISRYLNNFFHESLQAERDRQIEKLLRLMTRNPDIALKYSIPLGGGAEGGLGRGIAAPSSTLKERNIDFSIPNALGGGRAVDPWNIRDDLRRKLLESYREQARRESAAGRHRRAAYIYAHLLGDFAFAAAVLEQGKYYTEAADLYGKHLKRPRDQARCLIAAANFEAAATIFETLGDYIAAGDLWSKLDEPLRAKTVYEKAAESSLAKGDIIGAAKLIDEKLDQRQRATELLWQQWPYGQQVIEATLLAFRWLSETDRHTEAIERFKSIVDLANNNTYQTLLARLCAELYRNYPHATLKNLAEDQCRLSVAHKLDSLGKQECEHRMEILRSLHPQDHYLQRDSRRFLDRLNRAEPQTTIDKKTSRSFLKPMSNMSLPAAAYVDALMIGPEVLAIGWRSNQLIACRAILHLDQGHSGPLAVFANTSKALAATSHLYFNRDSAAPQAFVSFFGTEVGFPTLKLSSPFSGTPWTIAESPYPQMLKATYSEKQQLWALDADMRSITTYQNGTPLTCDALGAIRELVKAGIFSGIEESPNPQQVHLCCVGTQPFIALGNVLLTISNMRVSLAQVFDSPITHLSSSLPHSLPRLLVSTHNELRCYYLDSQKSEVLTQGTGYLESAFLHGGRVVALTENSLELYERNTHAYQLRITENLESRATCRLLPVSVDIFGLLMLDGRIMRWKHR
jgi:tetratricopeptide (TPR) repeat protein